MNKEKAMPRKNLCLTAVYLIVGASLNLRGQDAAESIKWVIRIKAIAGKELQFEEAYKEHLKWYADNNDSTPWFGWQYMAGPYTGQYVIGVPGQQWKNFDRGEMGKADSANARQTVAPHILKRQVRIPKLDKFVLAFFLSTMSVRPFVSASNLIAELKPGQLDPSAEWVIGLRKIVPGFAYSGNSKA